MGHIHTKARAEILALQCCTCNIKLHLNPLLPPVLGDESKPCPAFTILRQLPPLVDANRLLSSDEARGVRCVGGVVNSAHDNSGQSARTADRAIQKVTVVGRPPHRVVSVRLERGDEFVELFLKVQLGRVRVCRVRVRPLPLRCVDLEVDVRRATWVPSGIELASESCGSMLRTVWNVTLPLVSVFWTPRKKVRS